MRHFIAAFAAVLVFGLGIQAQETKTVVGLVADENGQPVPGVILKVEGVDETFKAGGNGRFEIKAPVTSKSILAVKDGYPPVSTTISGPFILIKMSRTAAVASTPVTAAPSPAETTAGTTAVVQVVPKKDKVRTEKPEIRKKAEKPAKPEKSAKPEKPAKPEVQCKEKGLCHNVDISGAWTLKKGVVVCNDIGATGYDCLFPLQLTYSIGYQFNRHVSLQAGAGFMYNTLDLCNGDIPDPAVYEGGKPRRWDVPVFATVKVLFGKRYVRPFLLFQGGIYAMSLTPCAEAGFGLRFIVSENLGLNLVFSAASQPWPCYSKDAFNGYPFNIAPSIKLGISF